MNAVKHLRLVLGKAPYPRRYKDRTASTPPPTVPGMWGTILCSREAVARETESLDLHTRFCMRVDKPKGHILLLSVISPHETVVFCYFSERPPAELLPPRQHAAGSDDSYPFSLRV